jgi:hypothetical protein
MPIFQLGDCSVELAIEPLSGELETADRAVAWRLYLALLTRVSLRGDPPSAEGWREFLGALETALAPWPAAQLELPKAGHLGHVLTTSIELVLLPCAQHPDPQRVWPAVRVFLRDLATELARAYRFPGAVDKLPPDLAGAWRDDK